MFNAILSLLQNAPEVFQNWAPGFGSMQPRTPDPLDAGIAERAPGGWGDAPPPPLRPPQPRMPSPFPQAPAPIWGSDGPPPLRAPEQQVPPPLDAGEAERGDAVGGAMQGLRERQERIKRERAMPGGPNYGGMPMPDWQFNDLEKRGMADLDAQNAIDANLQPGAQRGRGSTRYQSDKERGYMGGPGGGQQPPDVKGYWAPDGTFLGATGHDGVFRPARPRQDLNEPALIPEGLRKAGEIGGMDTVGGVRDRVMASASMMQNHQALNSQIGAVLRAVQAGTLSPQAAYHRAGQMIGQFYARHKNDLPPNWYLNQMNAVARGTGHEPTAQGAANAAGNAAGGGAIPRLAGFRGAPDAGEDLGAIMAPDPGKAPAPGGANGGVQVPGWNFGQQGNGGFAGGGGLNPNLAYFGELQARRDLRAPFAQFRDIHPGVLTEADRAGNNFRNQDLAIRPWGGHAFPMEQMFEGFGHQIQDANRMGMGMNLANQNASVELKKARWAAEAQAYAARQAALANAFGSLGPAATQREKNAGLNPLLAALLASGMFGGAAGGMFNRRLPQGVNLNHAQLVSSNVSNGAAVGR